MLQLAKQHGDEPAAAAETAGVAPGLVLPDGSLELQRRQQLQHLRRNARYSLHGGSLLGLTFPRSTISLDTDLRYKE